MEVEAKQELLEEVSVGRRVERLLGAAPPALDVMSCYYVWRLATVFLVDEYASAAVDPDRPAAPSPAAVGNH